MSYGKAKGKGKAASGPYEAATPREPCDDSCKVYVGNMSWQTKWQTLKDFMGQAGNVIHAKIFMKDGKGKGKGKWDEWGNEQRLSKGTGVVEFSSAEEAQAAIASLNGMELDGRQISLDVWTTGWVKQE